MEDRSCPAPDPVVLVTGCGGFIGHRLCRKLLDSGIKVVGFDEFNFFYDPALKRERVEELLKKHDNFSIVEKLDLIPSSRITSAFHLAAQANVRYCENNPKEASRCNQELTEKLLVMLPPSCHFIYISSSSVYGKSPIPWGAATQPVPQGIYARSKLECEELVRQRGPPATIVRPFSVVGPGIRPDLAPAIFIDRLIHRDTVHVFGDGSASRDFTHVDDLVEALLAAMQKRASANDVNVYPIGSGKPRSVAELLNVVERATRRNAHVIHFPALSHELPITCADNSMAASELNFYPSKTLEQAGTFLFRSESTR